MNNQVAGVRVDLATDIDDLPSRFMAIHASSEAAKAVVRELKPVLGVDIPIMGSPWLMTGLASLLGRSNLASRLPAAGNVSISNVPGPPMTLYMAGAKMVHYFPVSIPYHGNALNITVQSYAGLLEFGLTACRRILSQDESYELIGHLHTALREIQALPSVAATATPLASVSGEAAKVSTKGESVVPAPPALAPERLAAAEEVANTGSNSDVKPSTVRSTQRPRRSGRRMPHAGE
jgi:diacylglycerol O-acyltransferase / wax synthase